MPVMLYWDIENLSVPRGHSVSAVWGRIRECVHGHFGSVLGAYAYGNPQFLTADRRAELAANGIDLIDVNSGKGNAADFRIVSRAYAFALASVSGGGRIEDAPATVILTGDGDFANTLSTLRNFGMRTGLVFDTDRREIVNSTLLEVVQSALGVSFGGAGTDDDAACDAASPPAIATPDEGADERSLLLSMERASHANDDGWMDATAVGELFHKLRGIAGPKNARQAAFKRARVALTGRGLIDVRHVPGTTPRSTGATQLRLCAVDDHGGASSS